MIVLALYKGDTQSSINALCLCSDVSGAVGVITGFATDDTKFYMFRSVLQTATYHYQG